MSLVSSCCRKAQGWERVLVRGRDRVNIPQVAEGIYGFPNYLIPRPKCGLIGLNGRNLLWVGELVEIQVTICKDQHSVEGTAVLWPS